MSLLSKHPLKSTTNGCYICTKNTLKNPQLNFQHGVSKLRVIEKYMPKVEELVGV
jgi:hypothetical protein